MVSVVTQKFNGNMEKCAFCQEVYVRPKQDREKGKHDPITILDISVYAEPPSPQAHHLHSTIILCLPYHLPFEHPITIAPSNAVVAPVLGGRIHIWLRKGIAFTKKTVLNCH